MCLNLFTFTFIGLLLIYCYINKQYLIAINFLLVFISIMFIYTFYSD